MSRTPFPYSKLTYDKAWVDVPTLTTKVRGKFYVAVHAHSQQNKGIYVGYEKGGRHSSLGTVGKEAFTLKPTDKKLEWMIRPKLTTKPVFYE